MRRALVIASLTVSLAAQAQDDDLGSAFGPPPPPKKYQPEQNVPKPPLPDDPNAELRAAFVKDLAAAQKALDGGDAAKAKEQLALLEVNAVLLGTVERTGVFKLGLAAAKKLGDKKGQAEAAEKWLTACGPPGDVAACRSAALDALAPFDKARAEKIKAGDACLTAAESSPGKAAGSCVDAAAALAQRSDDALALARVELIRALALSGDSKKQKAALSKLGSQTDDRTGLVRKKALEVLSKLELAGGNVEGAVKAAIQSSSAWASALPPDRRVWTRGPVNETACAEYEKTKGVGACHKLEKQLLGDYVFRDFSAEHSGDLLLKSWLVQVNEHYNVLIQDCLSTEIRRLGKNAAAVAYRVRWLAINDGTVDAVHAESTEHDTTPFVNCLRAQFGYWRYPKHDGEPQQVVQGFTVKSTLHTTEETE
jgi:hypothetical protein